MRDGRAQRSGENTGRQQEECTVKIFTCSLCKRCWERMVRCVPVLYRQMDSLRVCVVVVRVCVCACVLRDLRSLASYSGLDCFVSTWQNNLAFTCRL